MATRFYLPSSGTAPASPAISAEWEHVQTTRRPTKTTKSSTAMANQAYSPDAADDHTDKDSHFFQFVSDPLTAQTIIGQTVKIQVQGSESNAGNNCSLTWKLFVCSNDGTTIKETLVAIRRDGLELTTSIVNRGDSGTVILAVLEEGDRLVLELGIGGLATAAGGVNGHNGTLRMGDDQASDLAENDTETGSTFNGWFEFAENLTFQSSQSVVPVVMSQYRRRRD